MRKKLINAMLVLFFFVGLILLLYPTISDYVNSYVQTRAIADYVDIVDNLDEDKYLQYIMEAQEYNNNLLYKTDRWTSTEEETKEYNRLLNVSGIGIMGYIDIPCINVSLPIYHSVSKDVLQVAIGHMEGSSLPVESKTSHVALSGHRGLPSAELFSNLDKVAIGDLFTIQVLNETFTYEVDQILIVNPNDMSALSLEEGKEYCTLITCTPYGVNSHRLLVRGHRIESEIAKKQIRIISEASQIDPIVIAPIISIPILLILFMVLIFKKPN